MNNLGNCWGMAFKFCSPLFLTWTSHLAPLRGSRGLQLLPHKSYVRNLHGASLMCFPQVRNFQLDASAKK